MRLGEFRNRFLFGKTRVERRFGAALLIVAIGLSALLRIGGSEWREAVPKRLKKTADRYERQGRAFADEAERERLLVKSLGREHFVKTGLWWAALVNLLLAGLLFFTRPLWCGAAIEIDSENAGRAPPGRRFWIALAAALVVAAALRAPRMDYSLYNDEAYNFRQYIHGQYKLSSDGVSSFQPVEWGDTFWRNKANNGVPFSALAKIAEGDAAPGEIREVRLRLPALVPGLLSIGVIGYLGFVLFGGLAGGAAAWVLALHPWHLRYCTEARPYGLVLLFAALAMLFLARALRDNRWPAWLGFAFCQFALLWSFAGALYFAIGLNLAALFTIIRAGGEWRRAALGRWFAAGVLAAMPYLQLMAPNFPQMALTLNEVASLQGSVGPRLVSDLVSFLATGMPAFDRNPANAFSPALAKMLPVLLVLGLPAVGAILFFGIAALRRSRVGAALAWGNLLAFVIALGSSAASGGVLHYWYVIYLLPFAGLAAGAGIARMWAGSPRLRAVAVAAALGGLVLIQVPLRNYIGHPKEDLRAIAETTADGGAISAGFWTDALYDPAMRQVRSLSDLEELIAQSQREGRKLRVAFGHRKLAMAELPECVRLLESSGEFEKIAEFHGLEEAQFTAWVYEWRGRGQE